MDASTPLSVAMCPRHPGQSIVGSCERCGDYVCLSCAVYERGAGFCPSCAPAASLPTADLGKRFVGNLLDSLAFWGVLAAGGYVGQASSLGPGLALVTAASILGINMMFLHRRGQTIGKIAVGTRIVSTADGRVPLWRIVIGRGLLQAVGALAGIGIIDAAFILGPERRALHDRLAGTRVVEAVASEHVYARPGAPT